MLIAVPFGVYSRKNAFFFMVFRPRACVLVFSLCFVVGHNTHTTAEGGRGLRKEVLLFFLGGVSVMLFHRVSSC